MLSSRSELQSSKALACSLRSMIIIYNGYDYNSFNGTMISSVFSLFVVNAVASINAMESPELLTYFREYLTV